MPQMRAVMSGTSLEVAAAQKCLEEPRRLVNLQLQLLDLAVAHAPRARPPRLPRGPAPRRGSIRVPPLFFVSFFEPLIMVTRLLEGFQVSVEQAEHAFHVAGLWPSRAVNQLPKEAMFGCSMGPKQP